ncbi:MAG: GDYXXLXY domain-containing protein [Nannocystaceae bacterium]
MKKDRLLLVAVVVPILGLLALWGRAQFNLASGRPWVIGIQGYDPRDLISGHYLRYRYLPRWGDVDNTCGGQELDPGCCVCFVADPDPEVEIPWMNQRGCDDRPAACESWVQGSSLAGPQRFFVPEEHALQLEQALRERDAALEVRITDDGVLAVDHLRLDGIPWTPR